MADSDDDDLVRHTMTLTIQMQSLQIGNSILRAEIERLEKLLAEAEAERRNKRGASAVNSVVVLCVR